MKYYSFVITGIAFVIAGAQLVQSATIASQDFNSLSDLSTFLGSADSVGDGAVLPNAGSQNSGGPGLDFTTTWNDTRGETTGPVLSSNDSSDFIGVNSFSGANSPDVAADGATVSSGSEHNFEFNDADGRIDLIFEAVNASSYNNVFLALNYWIPYQNRSVWLCYFWAWRGLPGFAESSNASSASAGLEAPCYPVDMSGSIGAPRFDPVTPPF